MITSFSSTPGTGLYLGGMNRITSFPPAPVGGATVSSVALWKTGLRPRAAKSRCTTGFPRRDRQKPSPRRGKNLVTTGGLLLIRAEEGG